MGQNVPFGHPPFLAGSQHGIQLGLTNALLFRNTPHQRAVEPAPTVPGRFADCRMPIGCRSHQRGFQGFHDLGFHRNGYRCLDGFGSRGGR